MLDLRTAMRHDGAELEQSLCTGTLRAFPFGAAAPCGGGSSITRLHNSAGVKGLPCELAEIQESEQSRPVRLGKMDPPLELFRKPLCLRVSDTPRPPLPSLMSKGPKVFIPRTIL